ncbi:MAG TPA: transposase [Verrucomicrobiae bacterium]|nr:transposase [Verrucomicrobiae bacterium]
MAPTVLGALRQFLPDFLKADPSLSSAQRRALWAITHCRTPALGGRAFVCQDCQKVQFAWHSCNHKACPQCGAAATTSWVQRELAKLVQAPYFLVTFTLPAQLRDCFFGPLAKQAYDLFFTAVSGALSEKLANDKNLRATVHGFTAVLHTWNQQMGFHPHIHCLVPGAGLNDRGRLVRVKQPDFLLYLPHLQCAFRQHLRDLLKARDWQVDPAVWGTDWGVHIQPAGNGVSALKYLSTYVARTAISSARIQEVTSKSVSFRWKNRAAGGRQETLTVPGVEFVRRFLRHVLPRGLRSIRYYGFCHPAAKANRLRVQLHSGRCLQFGAITAVTPPPPLAPQCSCCRQAMQLVSTFLSPYRRRGPPSASVPSSVSLTA